MITKQRIFTGALAIVVACAINYVGERLLGLRLEMFYGITETFNGTWIIGMFVLPFIVGLSVSSIFGLGGKWLCYFPPMLVRAAVYINTVYLSAPPTDGRIVPIGWYLFLSIVCVESAALGGAFGEVMVKRVYGRTSPEEMKRRLIQPGETKPAIENEK